MAASYESKESTADRSKFNRFDGIELDKFDVFQRWLKSNGAKFDKVELRDYGNEVRGCHARQTIEEDEIGGYLIPPKTTIFMSQMITHNDPRFFKSPDIFLPERFLNKDPYEENPGSYFPFVLGPRRCIGEEFSLVEAKIILSGLIKGFSFSIKENFRPKPVPSITLQAKTGMPMYIKVRE